MNLRVLLALAVMGTTLSISIKASAQDAGGLQVDCKRLSGGLSAERSECAARSGNADGGDGTDACYSAIDNSDDAQTYAKNCMSEPESQPPQDPTYVPDQKPNGVRGIRGTFNGGQPQ